MQFLAFENAEKIYVRFWAHSLGLLQIAVTERGICKIDFVENKEEGKAILLQHFPECTAEEADCAWQEKAIKFIENNKGGTIPLCLKGTAFQLKVWKALTEIPAGKTRNYGEFANYLNLPASAARAVGTAIGKNPVALIIPCHRVLQQSGKISGFRWGIERKAALLKMEHAILL